MSPTMQNFFGSVLVVALTYGLYAPEADADSTPKSAEQISNQELVGYSVMGAGGFLTWIGVFAGFAGKSPCENETVEQSRRACYDREKNNSRKHDNLRLGVIGAGLTGIATGLWLVKTSEMQSNSGALHFDGDAWSLSVSSSH